MASKKKAVVVTDKYEVFGIEPGRYGVGNRIIDTDKLDDETCVYLIKIKWPHIRLTSNKPE